MPKSMSKAIKQIMSVWQYVLPVIVLISIQFLVMAGVADEKGSVTNEIINQDQREVLLEDIDKSSDYIIEFSGKTSHYAHRFQNRKTASGERFDLNQLTAAHRKLPFGTIIRVTNLDNEKSVLVRINDRGPHIRSRILDLSYQAAKEIDGLGLSHVKIEGFIRGTNDISVKYGQEYMFGYSTDSKPICVPRKAISIVDSSVSFKDALEAYENLKKDIRFNNAYIFVKTDIKEDKNIFNYFIAVLDKKVRKGTYLTATL